MNLCKKCKIKVSKSVLLFLAGMVWSIAGGRVLTIGYEDFTATERILWGCLLFSLVVFYLFFIFVFKKIVKKHTARIMVSELSEHCIFSFFDVKGYVTMVIMIIGGITLRNAHVINPIFLGAFYMGLGLALFSAGILFLASSFKC